MKMIKVKDKKTGEIFSAFYHPYRNKMSYWVNEIPYTDKKFGKKFQIVSSEEI